MWWMKFSVGILSHQNSNDNTFRHFLDNVSKFEDYENMEGIFEDGFEDDLFDAEME